MELLDSDPAVEWMDLQRPRIEDALDGLLIDLSEHARSHNDDLALVLVERLGPDDEAG